MELTEEEKKLIRWKFDPVAFAHENFPITLDIWQQEVLIEICKNPRVAVKSGHGVGKSCMMAIAMTWFLSTRTPAKIICTAPTAHQLFDILWAEVSIWLRKSTFNLLSVFRLTEDGLYLIEAPKENFAQARTARRDQPEGLQGAHSENFLYILDETSGIPENLFEVIEGSLSTHGAKILMCSNPTRTSGYFYNAFHKFRTKWKTFTVSCFSSTRVDTAYIEDMAKYGTESNIYRVRVLGEFPKSDDDCVIGLDVLESAIERDIGEFGEVVWGLDVARFGSAMTALAKRQGGRLLEPTQAWSHRDTMQTSNMINKIYQDTAPTMRPYKIVVDVVGLGAGVADRLKEMGLPIVAVNAHEVPSESEKYLRMRDELWFRAREWFMAKSCSIPEDQFLISELSGPRYFITPQGKMRVESKDEMKKRALDSPDRGDAFVLTFCNEKPRLIRKQETKVVRPTHWMSL